jgi:urease accessory protein
MTAAIAASADPLGRVRSHGTARLRFKLRGADTVLGDLYQQGCAKLRFPDRDGKGREAVLINTAGGLTGGDRFDCSISWDAGTAATVTSQAAERIYRSGYGPASVATDIAVGPGAHATWLPQETILFDGGRVERITTADVAEGGTLIACESLVVGRRAMGETVRSGSVRDAWRVRHGGRLVFADTFRLDGDIAATLARPSIADGAEAFATVLVVGEAVADRLTGVRALAGTLPAAVAATARGPVLVTRIMAASGAEMRAALIAVFARLRSVDGGVGLPRVWNC